MQAAVARYLPPQAGEGNVAVTHLRRLRTGADFAAGLAVDLLAVDLLAIDLLAIDLRVIDSAAGPAAAFVTDSVTGLRADLAVDRVADLFSGDLFTGNLAALASMDGDASSARSMRTTGRMMTTAGTPGSGAGLPRNGIIPRGNLMTAPIVPPGRLTEWSDLGTPQAMHD